jgi:hypothetical protein
MKLLEQLINLLAAGAILLTMLTAYLVANKLWTRKHEKVVAESISVSAQLIGIVTMLPFLIKYMLFDGDYMSFANMMIRLALTLFFLAIGVGFWVSVQRRENLLTKAKRALKLEKEESLDLINALIRPSGAKIMLDVLQKLAVIDNQLDEREKTFIQDFADQWNIRIDFSSQFDLVTEKPTGQMYIEIHSRLSDYLSISPERKQASQFLDIIKLLIDIDQNVSNEEEFIAKEIIGMIEAYVNDDGARAAYSVIVVPQDGNERAAIKALLPDAKPRSEWGGNIYYAGVYHSRGYAEMMSEYYQGLNLFSTVKTV